MAFDPEELETAMTAALTATLPAAGNWQVGASDRTEAAPGEAIIRWLGIELENLIHGQDPKSNVASAAIGDNDLRIIFNTARQAPRGTLAGLLLAVRQACFQLSRDRREDWVLDGFNEIEQPGDAANPSRAWQANVSARLRIEEDFNA